MLWLSLRFVKFIGLGLFAAGLLSGDGGRALRWSTAGLLTLWSTGYLLMFLTERRLSSPFILVALVASLGAWHATLAAATRGSSGLSHRWMAAFGLWLSVGVMVVRDADAVTWAVAGALAAGAAALTASTAPAVTRAADDEVRRWFHAVAWLEGATLLGMMGLAMPWRAMTGSSLDHGSGWIGWTHGTAFLAYVSAIPAARRVGGWDLRTTALAVVAAVIPLGTPVFVRMQRV